MEIDQILEKGGTVDEAGGNQILLPGGHHPKMRLPYYEAMLKAIKASWPKMWIHGFSPSELNIFCAHGPRRDDHGRGLLAGTARQRVPPPVDRLTHLVTSEPIVCACIGLTLPRIHVTIARYQRHLRKERP